LAFYLHMLTTFIYFIYYIKHLGDDLPMGIEKVSKFEIGF
jgi:hypothetical protein